MGQLHESAGRERILVVEDNEPMSELLAVLLSTEGYEVTRVDSAFGVGRTVRELQPLAVLLDLGLPFRSGADLLTELKSDRLMEQVPVIVISGLAEELGEERRALATAVFSKPVDIQGLLDVLNNIRAQARHETGAA